MTAFLYDTRRKRQEEGCKDYLHKPSPRPCRFGLPEVRATLKDTRSEIGTRSEPVSGCNSR